MKTAPCFIAAAPVAVCSVLSDIESRSLILSSVSHVGDISPLPVQAGSVFIEKRRGAFAGRRVTVATLHPPDAIAFRRRIFGLSICLDIRLSEGRGGTVVAATATTKTITPLRIFAHIAAQNWLREHERDLADIKRYVEQRANPAWRPGL